MTTTIDALPNELIEYILGFLPITDLSRTRLISKPFKAISDSHPDWKVALNLYFPSWQNETQQTAIDRLSYRLIFTELYQATFTGLTPQLRQFFEAALSNNVDVVKGMLAANPKLIKAESATGHKVWNYTNAERLELFSVIINGFQNYMEEFSVEDITNDIINSDEYKAIVDNQIRRCEEFLERYQSGDLEYISNEANSNQTNNQPLINDIEIMPIEPKVRQVHGIKKRIILLVLGLFSLALLGFGISIFIGAPLLVTALASTASAVSIATVSLGTAALIGAASGLVCLHQDKLKTNTKFLTPAKQIYPAYHPATQDPIEQRQDMALARIFEAHERESVQLITYAHA